MFNEFLSNLHWKKIFSPDIIIILVILLILFLFVVPATPWMVDSFILFNVVATILLLSLVIYVDTPTKLSFFPSILLVMTLFRVGLSIATSRLILLTAHAGGFINVAGSYLIGGNIVVGLIIFIIIAIVNFLVITKGAERVAEVVARFTLDGLPGKQMSIDADLKAGNINMEEAQERRRLLQVESSLYGALDGATKFIKGDVISNMLIVAINLIGGIIIGIYQKDMELGDAVATYSILSIGDGILQQIPITLSSIAGGIIVTRINTGAIGGSIGGSITSVLKNSSGVLLIAAVILPLLFTVDGIPKVLVGSVFIFLIGSFIVLRRKAGSSDNENTSGKITDYTQKPQVQNKDQSPSATEDSSYTSNLPSIDPWKVYPIIVILSQDLVKSKKSKTIRSVLESANTYLYSKLGVELPQIFITHGNLPERSYQILVNEVMVSEATLYEDVVLVPNSEIATVIPMDQLIENKVNIGQMELGYWVSVSQLELIKSFEFVSLTVDQFLLEHVTNCLVESIQDLIGFQEIKLLLDRMNEYQELIKELLKMIPLNKITDVIKRLLVERIPIRNFKVILDQLLEWSPKESETILLVEYVRIGLSKYITQMFKVDGKIYAVGIDSELEDRITDSMRYTNNGFYLDLVDSFYDDFNQKLGAIIKPLKMRSKVVVITKLNIRRAVAHIIGRNYNVAVLSYDEVQASAVTLEVFDFIY